MENMNIDKGILDGSTKHGIAKLKEAALTASTTTKNMKVSTTPLSSSSSTVRPSPLTPLSTVWVEKHHSLMNKDDTVSTTESLSSPTEGGISSTDPSTLSKGETSSVSVVPSSSALVLPKASGSSAATSKNSKVASSASGSTVPKLLSSINNSSSTNNKSLLLKKSVMSTTATSASSASSSSSSSSLPPPSNSSSSTTVSTPKSSVSSSSSFELYRGKAKAWREEHKARVATESVLEQIGEASKTMSNERWRQRVGITNDTKVCIVSMAYPDIRDALLSRGWKQNTDFESPHFDLKYVLKAKHANHRSLLNGQVVNHFEKSNAICTKAGLLKVLRSTHWFAPVNSHSIYPRAYDLADPTDYAEFIDDFRCVEAEKILRTTVTAILLAAVNAKIVHPDDLVPQAHNGTKLSNLASSVERGGAAAAAILGGSKVPFDRTLYLSSTVMKQLLTPPTLIQFLSSSTVPTFNLGVIKAALNVTRKRCREWDDAMLDDPSLGTEPLVTNKEWEILRYCDIFKTGGPVEQASTTLANEAALRANEEAENAKKDKQIKRMLKRKGQAAANAVLTSTKSGKDVLTTTLAAVQQQQLLNQKNDAEDQEDNEDGNDDDDDDESEGDDSDSESDNDDDNDDGDQHPNGKGQSRSSNPKDNGTTKPSKPETVLRNGEYKVLTGAVGSVQLRAWRDRLEKEGGDVSIFNESIGDPTPTVSSGNRTDSNLQTLEKVNPSLWSAILEAIGLINDNYTCQSSLNGCPPKNVWIVKPAGKSRGRGIECESSLSGILNQRGGTNHKETHWIVQKYIERPLLIKNRKWDIRQWVLVTSWNPLTIWFYNKCYLRFCSYPFELGNLSNRYIHLSNNSIQKHSGAFDASDIEGNMWHMKDFARWLQDRDKEGAWDGLTYVPFVNTDNEENGKGIASKSKTVKDLPVPPPANPNGQPLVQDAAVLWNQIQAEKAKQQSSNPPESSHRSSPTTNSSTATTPATPLPISGCPDIWGKILQPQIRRIVSWSLQSAQDTIDGRTGDFEIYGFDFMIDADLHPWLIEINSSPDFSYSTAVTEELVQEASEEIIQVVVDYKEWEKDTQTAKQTVKEAKKLAKQSNTPFSLASLPATVTNALQASAPDTGNWELIYRSPLALGQVLTCTATGMSCIGTAIKLPTGNKNKLVNANNKLKQAALATVFASALRHKERTEKNGNDDKSLNSSFSSITNGNDVVTGTSTDAENNAMSIMPTTTLGTANTIAKVPLLKARLNAATALDNVIQQQAQVSSVVIDNGVNELRSLSFATTNRSTGGLLSSNQVLPPPKSMTPKVELKLGTATFSFDTNFAFDNPPISLSSRPASNGSRK